MRIITPDRHLIEERSSDAGLLPDRCGSAPIGVFDSGVGGLSVLQALKAELPDESFIYVADSAHAPYGEQSADFIEARAGAVAAFLVGQGAKALVLACNTASVVAARRLRTRYPLPIIAMEPAIKPATLVTKSKVVLVLATAATIQSDAVARLCREHGTHTRILLQPCSGLVEQIERGRLHDPQTRSLLQQYIGPGVAEGADTLVLGCTHYAFLIDEMAAVAGPAVTIVEPSAAVARQLSRMLASSRRSQGSGPATTAFYTSGSPQDMSRFLASVGIPHAHVEALPTSDACTQRV